MQEILVIKGNTELRVPADQKDRYMRFGYSVIDETGNIIEEAPLRDIGALQLRVGELLKEIEEYKKALELKDAEIAELEAQVAKKTRKKATEE